MPAHTLPRDPLLGLELGHYRIIEKLGGGGMGVVYKAEDTKLGRTVALKVLPPERVADPNRKRRFIQEARAASALNHPNIVTIHDIDEADGVHFIAMEYVQGKTLDKLITRHGLPVNMALKYAVEMAAALAKAHSAGIVHRDLKPSNVMVTDDVLVKVLDFGLAKLTEPVPTADAETVATVEPRTEKGTVVGTVGYMSPEQAEGKPVDARSDIFSFGSVLYEMLTGRRAFQGETKVSTIAAILKEEPKPLSEVAASLPHEIERLVKRCLRKDPAHRFQHMDDLKVALEELKEESDSGESAQALATRLPGQIERGGVKPSPRRRTKVALAGMALLACLVVGLGIWYRHRGTPITTTKPGQLSIAVLPLQNLSGDAANDYFSDGMSEEISTKLSGIQTLTVAPYPSTGRLKAALKSPGDIARELQVRYLLDGSVRRAGDQVKVNVRLFDSSTGFQVWADDFVGDMKDVFSVQEQAALKIAGALNLHLSEGERRLIHRRYTQNPEAYDAYLQGHALLVYEDEPDKLAAAETYFEQALKLDPNYALALADYSQAEGLAYRDFESDPARMDREEQLARRALSIDPGLPEAHVAMGRLYGDRYEYPRAAQEFRDALRVQPQNASAWDMLSWVLAYQEPPDAVGAEEAAREAIRLEPSRFMAQYHLGRALYLQQRYDEAHAAFDKARELSRASSIPLLGLGQLYLAQGDPGRAVSVMEQAVPLKLGAAIDYFWLASAYSAHGDREKALETMKKAFDAGFRDFAAIDANSYLASLRSDPRFRQLVAKYRK